MAEVHTVVVGASAAGLAASACLTRAGVEHVLLEQEDRVAGAWRRHYDRLHLHTSKGLSALPYLRYPRHYPRYPSRDQVVEYLEGYARHFGLRPRFGERVRSIRREDGRWVTEGDGERWTSRNVVVATGYTRLPAVPDWPGREAFGGEVLHSSRYRNGAPFRGREVLVVGFGNSGGEIAIDLHEHGARPSIAVRSPVNVIPRDVLGVPVLGLGIAFSRFPTSVADRLGQPILRLSIGDVEKLGLRRLPYGPIEQIRRHGRIPLLDVGTIDLIRRGHLDVLPGIARFDRNDVVFQDGRARRFDAVVLATGYRPGLADFLTEADAVCDARGVPHASGRETLPGLYFCGFYVSPTGMLREIALEAKRIARLVRDS